MEMLSESLYQAALQDELPSSQPSPAPLAFCSGSNEGTLCSGVTHEWGSCSPTPRRETQSPGVHWTRQPTATTSRSLLWRWSMGAGQTLPREHSSLPGSLAKQFEEKKQMHSHNPTGARVGRAVPRASASPRAHGRASPSHLTLTSSCQAWVGLNQSLPFKALFNRPPGSKGRRITLCVSTRSITGVEGSQRFFYSQRREGRDAKCFHLLAVVRGCLEAGF